jgi:hypothetical protein
MNTNYRSHLVVAGALWPFLASTEDLSNIARPVMISDWGVLVPAIDVRTCRLPSRLSPGAPLPERCVGLLERPAG